MQCQACAVVAHPVSIWPTEALLMSCIESWPDGLRYHRGLLCASCVVRLTVHDARGVEPHARCGLCAVACAQVRLPNEAEVPLLAQGAVLVSPLQPAQRKELVTALAARKVTAIGMDCIPRTLR